MINDELGTAKLNSHPMQCPICDRMMSDLLWQKPGLGVVRCPVCGFYGADLTEWHYPYANDDYYKTIDPAEINPERPYVRHRVREIAKYVQSGRAVDLGCGLGETAIALARTGFSVQGVEESINTVNLLRKNFPEVQWHNAKIDEFLRVQSGFDLITLFHVLEHVPMPRMLCESIDRSLRHGGLLVVEVPDVSGGQACLRGWGWQHWLPHHVNYFSQETLCRLFEPLGLELLNIEYKYHFGFPQGIFLRDLIHGSLARLRMHDIITTYWRKPG